MQVVISGRHVEVTQAMREHVETTLDGIYREENLKITAIKVLLSVGKHLNRAEYFVNCKGHELTSCAEDPDDMYKAIDAASEKMERQLSKVASKAHDHKAPPVREIAEDPLS